MILNLISETPLSTYWKRLPFQYRAPIVITIPLLCLIATLAGNLLLHQKTIESQAYVEHTQQVLLESQSSLIDLLNAETGIRGYYLTLRPEYLESYHKALTTIQPTLNRLQQLVQDNPTQLQRAHYLNQIAQQRLSLLKARLKEANARLKTAQTNPTLGYPSAGLLTGQRVMNRFRSMQGQFEAEERRLLSLRAQTLEHQQNLNLMFMWGSVILGGVGTTLSLGLFKQLTNELQEREARLRESRNLIRAIAANVVDGVMVISPQGKIASFNNAAVKMFGYTPAEVIGWDWQRLLTLETEAHPDQKLIPAMTEETLPTGKTWQARGRRQNGKWFPIEISVSRIEREDDRIAIVRDISDRLQATAKLQAKTDELAELNAALMASNRSLAKRNQELDQFAYLASHDLKAPLRAIASLSEWMEEDLAGLLPAQNQIHMHLLRGRVHRLEALLNGLLEYARVGRIPTAIATVNVADLLTEVIESLTPPPSFQIEISPDMPTLTTQHLLLKQVFKHLIDNAIRHHPTASGWIKVSGADIGDRYEFTIIDDGQGIDPQFYTKIFTIFQTLKARDVQENTGVGLAIVKKIIDLQGGAIHLESALGKGAVFRFTWLK